jgi:hypothetical protein
MTAHRRSFPEPPGQITGPMAPFESVWALQALSGLLGQSEGAGPTADSTTYASVPTLEPPAEPGSTLKYRLSRSDQPWNQALGCLAVTLLWNGVTWVFVWVQINGGIDPRSAGWKAWLSLGQPVRCGLSPISAFQVRHPWGRYTGRRACPGETCRHGSQRCDRLDAPGGAHAEGRPGLGPLALATIRPIREFRGRHGLSPPRGHPPDKAPCRFPYGITDRPFR